MLTWLIIAGPVTYYYTWYTVLSKIMAWLCSNLPLNKQRPTTVEAPCTVYNQDASGEL